MHIAAHHTLTNSHLSEQSTPTSVAGVFGWLDRTVARWNERQADIHALEMMSERDLRDAGLTRFAVERELARPFWRD